MKIQQRHSPTLMEMLKEQSNSGCNFREKLPTYLKEIDLRTKMLEQDSTKNQPISVQKQLKFSAQKNKLSSNISTLMETSNKMYYFLARNSVDKYSQIVIYQYMKADGKLQHMQLTGVKGVIMAMTARFCPRRKLPNKISVEQPRPAKRSQSSKNSQENTYEVVMLLGTQNGHLKTVRFNDFQSSPIENRSSIQNLKLDHTPIVDIFVMDPQYYSNANVCLILSMTNHVYLVNFDSMSLLAFFMPTIVNCEVGLSLAVNYERQYFVQASEGGYIIFWDINDKIRQLIKDSCSECCESGNITSIKSMSTKKEQDQNPKEDFKSPKFKSSQIHHCITPISIFHSATITGIKFCQLYGNLLLIVTQGGVIKLLALKKSSYANVNENQFCTLLQYQVQDGELISDVKFFPESRDIFVVKNVGLEGVLEKSGEERFIHIKEFFVEKISKKKQKIANNNNTTFPFRPTFFKEIKLSLHIQQRQRSKSVGNTSGGRCYFERISFNGELQIERVDKIYPNHMMECIDSVDLVEGKDLVFLRGKEFYLVGQTDFFKTIELQ